MSELDETIRTSSRSGLRDSVLGTRNLMTLAALSVVGSLVVVPLSIFTPIFATTPRSILILCAVMGAWYLAYLLPGLVVPKPGAFLVAGLLMGIISTFTTPLGPTAIIGNVIGAAFLEIPIALFLYRKWTWWTYGMGATVFGGLNAAMYGTGYGVTQTPAQFVIAIVVSLISCYATLALCFLLRRSLQSAGVAVTR
ncbi:ECF transporter S component [Actinomyces sp. B33]|uniref:ECF transporter S component n=1 Tax=Actinomyces sp. B33 TaxID=2942131 RepID=UPI0023414419|nr:ECF transporter S component [Actinomyces sp. B33]MDC4232163.1 ECF transporter S component [Actinomyces sp. B33]